MKFSDFKTLAKIRNRGGLSLPSTDSEWGIIIQDSLEAISEEVIPIDLLTQDTTQAALRFINSRDLIRKPVAPIHDNDKIDIDEGLVKAVLYHLLTMYSNDQLDLIKFTERKDDSINTYIWNNHRLLEQLGLTK